ncbi:MAG: hypothetical protein ACI9BF_000456 [Candidatus Paceibacteria bacterium]|jgi:hypothetical protein
MKTAKEKPKSLAFGFFGSLMKLPDASIPRTTLRYVRRGIFLCFALYLNENLGFQTFLPSFT